ncbi:ribbon-helix-helix domain-containing protein [Ancylobacter sp. MQZ15Z-1]|uniref:Ribbon-helix-helix domain-containing protein n=1 Tax=Ancylobacter mangrovi TaxID=2972472 RepID=A0A9X2PIS5_9HYPH|nr:ribbon-helix-helix domain-containing protein [Ancylobacter mangrovi]MCS0497851.1 ribbon-helix-helix domain-containing protein [Ancylobacter mangrovi]
MSIVRNSIRKRTIIIGRHVTSVSLEDDFYNALKEIAAARHLPLFALINMIDADRRTSNLSSALRLFVLGEARNGRLPPART